MTFTAPANDYNQPPSQMTSAAIPPEDKKADSKKQGHLDLDDLEDMLEDMEGGGLDDLDDLLDDLNMGSANNNKRPTKIENKALGLSGGLAADRKRSDFGGSMKNHLKPQAESFEHRADNSDR